MTLHIVGDFEINHAIDALKTAFNPAPSRAGLRIPRPLEPKLEHSLDQPAEAYRVFENPLLTTFSIQFHKLVTMSPTRDYGTLRDQLLDSVIAMALDTRIESLISRDRSGEPALLDPNPNPNPNWRSGEPALLDLNWEYQNEHSAEIGQLTFSVAAEVERWEEALAIGIGEMHRLVLHGLGEEELKQQVGTFLRQEVIYCDTVESNPNANPNANPNPNWRRSTARR